jgi:DNA-binding NarL/FixJ family response regulator
MTEITTGSKLTPRESQVAALAARGLTNRQIGQQIGLSPLTVSNYLKKVFAKAGVQSRIELAWQYARAEMVPMDASQQAGGSQ